MEIRLLSCPLCLKPHFDGVDALRSSLITIATSQISCPVCNELLMGLDKLTIHLFSHITNNILHENLNKPPVYVETENCHSNNSKVDLQPVPISEIHQPIDQQLAASATQKIEDSPLAGGDAEKACMKCDICNFSFTDENILEIHQKLLHQTKADKKTGTYSYHCHLCSKKFKMRGSLMVHLRVAHYGFGHIDACANNAKKGTCNDGGGLGSNGNQIEEFKSTKCQDNKQWECDICSKLFTTKYFLKKHKRLHTGEMPYFCAQCNKSFTFQQSYHKHMLYHTSEKPHVCNECGRAFKELSTLHNHERIHSGERPFACETCGKCFRQRVSYLVHRRIHTGAMPYKCTACDKSFRYKVSQKSHKCPVNPPGLVVRAPDLVEKLIQNNSQKVSDKSNVQNKERGSNEKSNKAQNEAGTIPAEKQMETDEISKVESRKSTCNPPQATVTSNDIPNFAGNINTIIFNSDGQIIGQNFAYNGLNLLPVSQSCSPNVGDRHCFPDINRNRKDSNDAYLVNVNILAENDAKVIKSPDVLLSDEEDPDFFSMVLSPVLPDVQSLCLSNGSSNDGNDTTVKEALETINEESFKKLLYGPMD